MSLCADMGHAWLPAAPGRERCMWCRAERGYEPLRPIEAEELHRAGVPPIEVRPAYRSDGALEVRVSIGGGWSARGTVRPVTDEDRARMTGNEPVDLSGFLTDSDPGDETP